MRAYADISTAWQRLATYLGADFRPELTHFTTLRTFLDTEWARLGDAFYKQSVGYLYDLTHFHYMRVKDPFFTFLLEFAREHSITDIADVGCGIALDTQALLQADLDVHGYDLDNPSLDYARWRLNRDLNEAHRIHALDQLPGRRHQLAYAVDVLGHAEDPADLIELLFTTADYVFLNLAPHDPDHRHGRADLHPVLNHQRVLADLSKYGDLIRLGTQPPNVLTVWRSHYQRQLHTHATPTPIR
ncbi:class I SAM-dependent methyltransferase [Saccharopolyspora endophytica]|uniref:Class I SAM-dependent methyltransferase n=1 Tax=Saccharopolyspora endophytica TaxID=543886 RepID=A0ABS5DK90_9PSEU|nr:class I SAM-dependent methyltransferase [Saccharopolyspora endophytica]